MKDIVLDLIESYESRVTAIENIVTNNYEALLNSDNSLSQAYETGQKLKTRLRETMVRSCSLRRKDFETLTGKMFASIDQKKAAIEEEHKAVGNRLRMYLERQKELMASLKGRVSKFAEDGSGKNNLELLISDIKMSQGEEGEQTFTQLRDFQSHLKALRQELNELNATLQQTLDRGELLKLEDLRHFRATISQDNRRAEEQIRKEDVQRLLAHFNRAHQENIRVAPGSATI